MGQTLFKSLKSNLFTQYFLFYNFPCIILAIYLFQHVIHAHVRMAVHVRMMVIVDSLVPALQDMRVTGVTSPVMVGDNNNLLHNVINVLASI